MYQCKDCDGCPLRSECTKAKQGRTVQRNEKWLTQKAHVNKLFEDAEYKAIAKRRSIECETVFGQIKGNHHTPVQSTGVWCSHKVGAVGFNTFYYGAEHRRY